MKEGGAFRLYGSQASACPLGGVESVGWAGIKSLTDTLRLIVRRSSKKHKKKKDSRGKQNTFN